MEQTIAQHLSSIVHDAKFQEMSSKQYEIVRAINCEDLIYLIDLGVLEQNCQVDLNFSINKDGLNPLLLACSKNKLAQTLHYSNSPRLVQLVLNTVNMRANSTDRFGNTALHIATQYHNLEIIKLLKKYKVYFDKSLNGTTPLHIACKKGFIDIVKFYIRDMQVDINQAKDQQGLLTPLALCIAKNHLDLAQYLIQQGANVTPYAFYLSCKLRNVAFQTQLLDLLRVKCNHSEDLLQATVINGRYDKTQSTPLMRACMYGIVDTTKYLIEKLGAIADATNANDETCLLIAVRHRQKDVVKYICQKVIRPNTSLEVDYECSRNGMTAFSRAVLQHDFEIADILLQDGKAFKGFVSKKEGRSILEVAQKLKNQQAVQYLNNAQGGAQKQTVVESKYDPSLIQQPSQQISKLQQQQQPIHQMQQKGAPDQVQLKRELNKTNKPGGENNVDMGVLSNIPETPSKKVLGEPLHRVTLNETLIKATEEDVSMENITQQRSSQLISPKQKQYTNNGNAHPQGMVHSEVKPLMNLNKISIKETPPSQSLEESKPNRNNNLSNKNRNLSIDKGLIENKQTADEVNIGHRPNSREELNQQASGQNMKETMDKLKNLKDEYRKKYTYKNFAKGQGPSPKKI